jgi:hypothetical protein
MGLLDKAGNVGTTPEKGPKAVAKAIPKAVAKAPAAVAIPAAAKTAVSKKAAKPVKAKKVKTPRTTGLPEGYELASIMNRSISWWINFAVNFSLLVTALAQNMLSGGGGGVNTYLFVAAGILIILNVVVIPLKTGRTIGHFVSRTKYISASGEKANVFHSILANTVGFFALMGIIMVGMTTPTVTNKDAGGITTIIVGIIFIILWFVNRNFKKNSDMDQGLYDIMFRAYLVKHIPVEGEAATGIWGRLENTGDWGDKLISKREANAKKAEEKAAAKAKKAEEDAKQKSKDETKKSKDE